MIQNAKGQDAQSRKRAQRVRTGNRTLVACLSCKERKLKCDNNPDGCDNCRRIGLACLTEDPRTKRPQPRNYLQTLEDRVALLEGILRDSHPDLAADHLDHLRPENCPLPPARPGVSSSPSWAAHDSHVCTTDAILGKDHSERDGYDELASKVGLLSLNAAGAEPHYLGSSSTFAFSRLISPSLRQVISQDMQKQKTGPFLQNQRIDTSTITGSCELPEYDQAMQLSNAYFQNIHPQYPFLYEPAFREWENLLLNKSPLRNITLSNKMPLFFLYMVYAVGALLLPTLGQYPEQLYMAAQSYIDPILSVDGLESIQAILCCAIYSLRSSIGTSHWKLAGLALRQCVNLGYHRHSQRVKVDGSPLRQELRRRIFWCTYVMESQASIMLGRPVGIPYYEIDAEYPSVIDYSHISSIGLTSNQSAVSADSPNSMKKAIHTFRLRHFLSKVHGSLYSRSPSCCSTEFDRTRHIQHLRQELENWRRDIPAMPEFAGESLALFTTSDWFDLEYDYAILQLYRLQIVDPQMDPTDPAFYECLKAAESICTGYRRQFLGKPTSCTWTAVHELFLAALTYVHCLWSSPTIRETRSQSQVSTVCTNFTIVLVIMAERWTAAVPYRDIFETIARRTVWMIESSQQNDTVAPQEITTDINSQDQEDWMQFVTFLDETTMSDGFNGLLARWMGSATT